MRRRCDLRGKLVSTERLERQLRSQREEGWLVSYALSWVRAEEKGQGTAGALIVWGRKRRDVGSDGVKGGGQSGEEGERGEQDWGNPHQVHRLD